MNTSPDAAAFSKKDRWILATELTVLIGGPVLLMGLPVQILRFSTIFLVAAYCLWRLHAAGALGSYLDLNWGGCRRAMPGILLRAALASIAIATIVLALFPDRLFFIPRVNPGLMAVIVAGYGLVSVLPQEVAFRGYAAWRLDRSGLSFLPQLLISALLFGWVHILFGSWLSVGLSFLAGLSFYRTYRKHQSLAAVWLEHSLFGIAIFAIGLDHLFYVGPGPG